ncbi:MAG: prolyl oligopeptidase family serine peptidase [Chitinophagaceae bacterium]|nr:prolyl oligopeptidase family serine peptidase [Chitinophagaceae bacterium]
MKNVFLFLLKCFLLTPHFLLSQYPKLTIEKIMSDPKWIGTSPSGVFWSHDNKTLYFYWNPENYPADSLYSLDIQSRIPVKVSPALKKPAESEKTFVFNKNRTAYVYASDGDIFYKDLKTNHTKRIVHTVETESNPVFSFQEKKIVYVRNQNLYAWDITSGETMQLTNFRGSETLNSPAISDGRNPRNNSRISENSGSDQEQWLRQEQLYLFSTLRERKNKRELTEAYNKSIPKEKELRVLPVEDKTLQQVQISPDGRFITYRLYKSPSQSRNTIVPDFVTESGYTTDIPSRPKVGSQQGTYESFIYDRQRDTLITIKTDSIPGIYDLPDYLHDYPSLLEQKKKNPSKRAVLITSFRWSPNGTYAVCEIRSQDNKDRWLMLLDTSDLKLRLLDRQRDEAWIGGPGVTGIGENNAGWLSETQFWYRSETTGYSHLYLADVVNGIKRPLTSGKFEVLFVQPSIDKKSFYLITNEEHPGEQHLYRLFLSGKKEKLTRMTGAHQVFISPDEKWLAYLHSYSTQPWELYLQENKPNGRIIQLTNLAASKEFKSYSWKDPEIITIPAQDGETIYARLYKPSNPHPARPAVLFVHGAGYLQNAHKWWSSYFREYLFHQFLAQNGYYVLDIDYRGSAGYGRNWRTGIYRHMGGKDLSDHVDAAQFLVRNYNVNPKNIGIYGGSYGGFITLMAMFKEPEIFSAGAALRPVTDWSNYNHGYTSNILNEPQNDSIAYRRSSPIYYTNGLKGHLLICHGMVDVNVHYQDVVKLAQRLIENGKDNWELVSYPVEDHAFTEPSSWTDEYKRIFRLFESVLKK